MQRNYINLEMGEEVNNGRYLLTVFHLVPKDGIDILDAASEVAAESSTGTSVHVNTDTAFAESFNAIVYKVDKTKNLVWIAYPWRIFDRGGNVQNIMTYIAGNIFGMSEVIALKLLDVWFPQSFLDQFDGPSYNIYDVKKYLGITDRPILGTIVKPKIGLTPTEFARVCYEFWKGGGDFVKFDEPQADQDFCPFYKTVDMIAEKIKQVEAETGQKKIMSFNISAADHDTMVQRADYIISKMAPQSFYFLVDGVTAGWTSVQSIRRLYPNVFLHFHRAGHGAYTRAENPIGYNVPFLTKFARIAGTSGMHTGTAGVGKMADHTEEGHISDDIMAAHHSLKQKSQGQFFEQDWGEMKGCTPLVSGGLNPLLLGKFIDLIGHTDFSTTMGGGVHGHPDGTRAGATALVQACEAYQQGVSLEEYAKDKIELQKAIEFYKNK